MLTLNKPAWIFKAQVGKLSMKSEASVRNLWQSLSSKFIKQIEKWRSACFCFSRLSEAWSSSHELEKTERKISKNQF